MASGRTKFTRNLRDALARLANDRSLGLEQTHSVSLFSPIFDGDYKWTKIMDSDGLLVGARRVKENPGEGRKPGNDVYLRVGVIIQSEDSTSQTKPNPLGKAAVGAISTGVWVDLKNGERVRLDCVRVLFVLPRGAPPSQQRTFDTAKRNVTNAAHSMPDVEIMDVPRGIARDTLATMLTKKVRPWLKGRGRPQERGKQ